MMDILKKAIGIINGGEPKDEKMFLKSRDLGNGKYEVNGVIFYADSHAESIRKYRRAKHGK